ncbi:MAG TPA: hypothetical protein VGN63_01945 [Flavisolibacter sp.]|jgi:hypothetical protein|nr:hypothetical protein [Flavisolibacter sp.]
MQKTRASLLLHPLFIGSLLILLLNDFWAKYAYPGMLTGKLSDFAGLMVLPVFCRVLFPALSNKIILIGTALFFAWWKSPLSQPLINFINEYSQWKVQRVVDYTDLIALSVLPLVVNITPKSIHLHNTGAVCLRWTLGLLSFFSLCSTSVYRGLFQAHPFSDDIYFDESFSVEGSAEAVLQALESKGIKYRRDSVMYYPVTNQNNLYYKTQDANDSGIAWHPVSTKPDSTLYIRQQGFPYYLIPAYKTSNRTFRNIRFTLSENRKKTKTAVTIKTFQTEGLSGYVNWDKKTRKRYKQDFAAVFSEP